VRGKLWNVSRRHSLAALFVTTALAAGLSGSASGSITGAPLAEALTVSGSSQSAPSPSAATSPKRVGSPSLVTTTTHPTSARTTSRSPRRDPNTIGDEERDNGQGTPTPHRTAPSSDGPVWVPPTPLPPAARDSSRVVVVLSPHPDDETLSLGVWISNAVSLGKRVIMVSMTDGRGTGSIRTLSARLGRKVTRDEIGMARVREFREASVALGSAPEDVYLARCDAERSVGGSLVTVPEAAAVVDAFAARFPEATFATMSWYTDRHVDHLATGEALRDAAELGTVKNSVFAVSRLWWKLPVKARTVDLHPTSTAIRRRVLAAAAAYQIWDPDRKRYSIGWLSVSKQFKALHADPHNRIHPGPRAMPPRPEP
jgi:LmbE family N-acetylglucosaminyl deacetylase